MGFHRNGSDPEVVTPTFDVLAAQGVILDRHYVYQFCSPTRSAFQTRRNHIHVNVINSPVFLPFSTTPTIPCLASRVSPETWCVSAGLRFVAGTERCTSAFLRSQAWLTSSRKPAIRRTCEAGAGLHHRSFCPDSLGRPRLCRVRNGTSAWRRPTMHPRAAVTTLHVSSLRPPRLPSSRSHLQISQCGLSFISMLRMTIGPKPLQT